MSMSPTSEAAVLFLVTAAALQLSAAAVAAGLQQRIAKPGCNTTCGNVSVPYPFGFSPGCYWPGLNLTCETSHGGTPRLLLGDGTLRVTEIFIENATVRVMRAGSSAVINATGTELNSDGWNVSFGRGFAEYGYKLSYVNELVVFGCNVVARILADNGGKPPRSIGGCASFCTTIDLGDQYSIVESVGLKGEYCTGIDGCCRASLVVSGLPNEVQAKWLYSENHTAWQDVLQVNVLVAEEGWVYKYMRALETNNEPEEEVPIVIEWSVTQDLPQHSDEEPDSTCPDHVSRILCKSEHSQCSIEKPGYTCGCEEGYDGNPYLPGGCQDIDECKLPSEESGCFGECVNTVGSMECRCPHRTFGNPSVKDGCVKMNDSTTDEQQLPTVAPVRVGLHDNCNTWCGDVRVPYPFGISPGCYWPGFNLTCNTSYNPPRLLLDSKGTLEVVNISLLESTVRVIYHTLTYTNSTSDPKINMLIYFYIPDIGEPYTLSTKNEFIFYGCNVQATLYGEYSNVQATGRIISSCNSTCRSNSNYIVYQDGAAGSLVVPPHSKGGYCSGRDDGCCHAPIAAGSTPKRMEIKGLNLQINQLNFDIMHGVALVSEDGMTDQWHITLNNSYLLTTPWTSRLNNFCLSSPLVLRWAVKQGFPTYSSDNSSGQCPREVSNSLCRSEPSSCRQENGGFMCYCPKGYLGNPYVVGGCQVIDECQMMKQSGKQCFASCINFPGGGHECRCPRGYFRSPSKLGGCIPTGLVIGLVIATGLGLLLLVLGTRFLRCKIEQHRSKLLKQRYFKQNRGQLLQQLVSQRADIAEKMIIPVDELAKATNNFDKAREVGGGGHGTVYKGILSDLHVVAIKKSKITVQKEIDEFINEVAILSQINHKNVVRLFGCCLETEVPLLVYEFISNGTLYHHLHIQGTRSLSWDNRLRIATEIATSLAYLHSAVSVPIIHRDIKSTNVLLDDTLTAKVSDFGASRYIPIEKTGLTTRVQGTIGYLDPMYFQTNRLTEKSDVYSFGVILVELLTRKKPFSYLSPEGDGLVSHFLDLHAEAKLFQIIDPQVTEEGGEEVQEVAALAASCINLLRGDERPTMRQVEHTLERLRVSKVQKNHGMVGADFENDRVEFSCPSSTNNRQGFEESSRRYSLEQEMMMSARYPR